MKTSYRKMIIFFWVACQVVAFSLLFPTHVYADDCLTDPLNAADCMRTGGFRQGTSVVISVAGTLATILVNVLGGAATAAGEAARASTATTIYGTGTPDDPYRDAGAFKIGPDGNIERYPEMEGQPLGIYGTGTPDDPYRDYPDNGQTTTETAESDGSGESQPETQVQPPPGQTPKTHAPKTTGSQPVPPTGPQTPEPAGPQTAQIPETPLPQSPVVQAPLPPEPATPQTPQTPTSKTDEKGESGSQKEDSGGEKENKGLPDAVKEAAENYGKNLEDMSDKLEKIKEQLAKDPNFSPEAKEKFNKYIDSFNESLGKAKGKVEAVSNGIGKYTDLRDQVKDVTKELDKNIREVTEAHQQALDNLKDLPSDAANAAADLSAALDGFGRGLDAALNKVPGYKMLGGDKTFDVTNSFQEAGKGVQKVIKTIKTSETEAKDLSKNGDSVPGYTPKDDIRTDPEYIEYHRIMDKNPQKSTWDSWKEFILGKTPDERTKGFR